MQPDEELDLSTDPAILAERYREQRDTWHGRAREFQDQLAEATSDVTKLVEERDRLKAQLTQARHELELAERGFSGSELDEVRARANAAMQAAGAAGVALLEFVEACEKKFGFGGRRG